MEWLNMIHGPAPQSASPSFGPGDEVRVWFKIIEQGKERLGQFEGLVIRYRGAGPSKTFTVRRVTYGEGVERVFPVDAKVISRIDVLRKGRVKRSRLYFLRTIIGKTRITSVESQIAPNKASETIPGVNKTVDAEGSPEPSQRVEAVLPNVTARPVPTA